MKRDLKILPIYQKKSPKGMVRSFFLLLLFFAGFINEKAFSQVPPSKLILEDPNNLKEKEREGFLNNLIQPFRFSENRKYNERKKVIKLIRELTENEDLRIDSLTVNAIAERLMQLTEELEQNDSSRQFLKNQIDKIFEDLKIKSASSTVDSLKIQMGAVLQGLVDSAKKENVTQRNEILEKLQAIKKIQFKCGTGAGVISEFQINDSTAVTYETCLHTKAKVFGWHNAWVDNAIKDYNFNFLTDLIYYGYELGIDGNPKNHQDIEKLKNSELPNLTYQNDVGLSLSIYSKSQVETGRFLRNLSSQENLFRQLLDLKSSLNLGGINIYFEDLAPRDRDLFSGFIGKLKEELSNKEIGFLVTVSIPAIASFVDRNRVTAYDFPNLDSKVDFYLVQTDKLNVRESPFSGSPSPLFVEEGRSSGSIDGTFSFYTNGKVTPSKLVMTVSYLGISWPVPDFFEGSPATGLGKYIEYRKVRDLFGDLSKFEVLPIYGFDPVQVSSYYHYYEKNQMHTIWFEDGNSLYQKYNYALDQSLGGVAVWGLGYDDGFSELWDALGAAMVEVDSVLISRKPIAVEKEKKRTLWNFLDLYYDDMQWAAINDIYIGDPNDGAENYCEYKVCDKPKRDSLITRYGIESFWDEFYHSHYDSSLDPYENFLLSEAYCVCLIERWDYYTTIHGYVSLALLVILLILIGIIFFGLKRYGDEWNLRGILTITSFIVAFLMFVSLFLQLFFNGNFTLFGAGSEAVAVWVLVLILLIGVVFGIVIYRIHMSRKYEYKDLP
ncbi:glycosyl hydrolase family 18 protein [Aquiflexum sp.]|uniref:glycosyl hydrolase family 18 protein n=1 Tax=Aquiflexum sp. TaxID=1872584 RepID=UPI003593C684